MDGKIEEQAQHTPGTFTAEHFVANMGCCEIINIEDVFRLPKGQRDTVIRTYLQTMNSLIRSARKISDGEGT